MRRHSKWVLAILGVLILGPLPGRGNDADSSLKEAWSNLSEGLESAAKETGYGLRKAARQTSEATRDAWADATRDENTAADADSPAAKSAWEQFELDVSEALKEAGDAIRALAEEIGGGDEG